MKINVDSHQEGGAYFVSFTHVANKINYHTYIRLEDIKSWTSVAKSGGADRSTRWLLETKDGDVYYTLTNFNEIMETSKWYPRSTDGRGAGRIADNHLYGEDDG